MAVENLTKPTSDGQKTPEPSKNGLTSDEARRQLAKSGPNAMPDTSVHPLRSALEKFWAPVPWMLEAAIITLLLIFNAVLGLFQESRAQATLTALKSRLALTSSVKRDGVWKTVPAVELVLGDMVKPSFGGIVAGTLAAAVIFAILLDLVKVPLFRRLNITYVKVLS